MRASQSTLDEGFNETSQRTFHGDDWKSLSLQLPAKSGVSGKNKEKNSDEKELRRYTSESPRRRRRRRRVTSHTS